MPLNEYRRKRDFRKTPEPRGVPRGRRKAVGLRFVVQKHAARRLHYDLRLELDGVLKSWAVPKGPSRDPAERRLAVHVEDHPLDYGDFEGVIPEGEYGGGTVQLWDQGTWTPEGDPATAFQRGRLHFTLRGERLTGRWTLVRTGRRDEEGDNWLLMKGDDEYADPAWEDTDESTSVVSGRTLAQIAAAPERTWTAAGAGHVEAFAGAAAAALPDTLAPQLATAVETAPGGDEWLHEIKFDGYRVLTRLREGKARLFSRSGQDWTRRFRAVAEAIEALPAQDAWLDGEMSVLRADGTTSFQGLQEALAAEADAEIVYFLFDLPYLDGRDLRRLPLVERKALLARLLAGDSRTVSPLRFTDHVRGNGPLFFAEACRLGLEGIVAKRGDASYRSSRSRDWQKVKCHRRQEFVIGGYTEPRGGRFGFGALLVGYRDNAGELVFAGRVGTGFDDRTLRALSARLEALRRDTPPFAHGPIPKRASWVEPQLVAEVRFAEWTREGVLRMPAFLGLREDKPAGEVGQERPAPAESKAADEGQPPREMGDRIAGLRLSNPDKVLFPAQGLTKRDLAHYYEAIADWLLPELVNRPLTLLRCPEGRHRPCFFQKHVMPGLPPGLREVAIPEKGKNEHYLYLESLDGVIGLVQMGVLEIHTWGARVDAVERPDRLVFDLDPDEGLPWARVIAAARRLRALLDEIGLKSFPRTTGGKGLHVVVPIARRHGWDEAKSFAKAVVAHITHEEPRAYTISPSKSARADKIFLDYLRNSRGATAITSYSTRAREGATVAVNLAWDEVTETLQPTEWTVRTLPHRLSGLAADPWQAIDSVRQSITRSARRKLGAE